MSTTTTRTRPRTRRKAAAATAKKPKGGVEAKLQTMTRQASAKDGSIAKARKTEEALAAKREKARGDLLRLTSEKKNLQEAINAVKVQRKALETEREAAEGDLKTFTADHEELSKQIRKDKRFADFKDAVAAVDANIKEQRDKVEELEKDVAAAQREAERATRKAGELEAAHRSKQDELRSLPDRVREARGQLTKVTATMKAAVSAGRIWEAHALESDFDLAVKNLQERSDRKQEAAVIGSVLASGKLEDSRRKVETTAKDLATAKDKLQAARSELQKRMQERQKKIREKLEPPSKK